MRPNVSRNCGWTYASRNGQRLPCIEPPRDLGRDSRVIVISSTTGKAANAGHAIGHGMKNPPKPFAIEIKRSRRLPASAPPTDLFGKDSSALNGVASRLFSRRGAHPNAGDASAFDVSAFLQAEQAQHGASPSALSTEAAELFRPRPTPAPEYPNPAPRILPSLIEPELVVSGGGVEPGVGSLQSARKSQGSALRARRPRVEKPARVEKTEVRAKPRADAAATGGSAIRSKRKVATAAGGAVALATAETKPAQRAENAAENGAANPGGNRRGARVRGFIRRGHEDAAALPPGQHWKRRLNPRAW